MRIEYKTFQFRQLSGDYRAEIVDVQVQANTYYDPSRDNSTKETLDVHFTLEDPETLESIAFTQRFVSPLIGRNLFTDIVNVLGKAVDTEGTVDVSEFIGLKGILTIGKGGKDKAYDTALAMAPIGSAKPKAKTGKSANEELGWLDEN